jgi:hypothetical protein
LTVLTVLTVACRHHLLQSNYRQVNMMIPTHLQSIYLLRAALQSTYQQVNMMIPTHLQSIYLLRAALQLQLQSNYQQVKRLCNPAPTNVQASVRHVVRMRSSSVAVVELCATAA